MIGDIVNIKGEQRITGKKYYLTLPQVPTALSGTSGLEIANTEFVANAINALDIPTLQQVAEAGSVAALHQGAITPITVGFGVISDVDNRVAAMSASLTSVSLTTGTTDLGANGFGATQSNTVVQFGGLSRINIDATSSVIREFPLKYLSESTIIRPLLVSDDMIPSIGKVSELIAARITYVSPASATAPGTKGDIAITSTFIYFCVDTDTWVRVVAATW